MELKIKRLREDAKMPVMATKGAACFDLTACSIEYLSDTVVKCHTGIAMEIPEGHVGLLFPRSSVYKSGAMLANGVGVIDSDYRGEVCAIFNILNEKTWFDKGMFNAGDRVCQIMIRKVEDVELQEVQELTETSRGEGAFGSTGRA